VFAYPGFSISEAICGDQLEHVIVVSVGDWAARPMVL
jgi:hypothetical protein